MICNVDPVATVAVWLRVMRLLAASTMTTPETIIRMRGTAILLAIFKSYGYPEIEGLRLKDERDDVVTASKVRLKVGEEPNRESLSRYHIMDQVEKSLKRLRTDRIDLYQTHRWDYWTPVEETRLTLNDLVLQGSVNYIGTSSMFAWQLAKALAVSDRLGIARFVSMQNHYNLCY